jgi:hypothetical protein
LSIKMVETREGDQIVMHCGPLISFSCFMPLNRQRYSWILCYALASMWCLAVNARVKSIELLTMKGVKDIQKQKFHLSTSFKTCLIYHYQVLDHDSLLHSDLKLGDKYF